MSIITHIKCMYIFLYIKRFTQNENYAVDQRNLKCDFLRHSPAETSTINSPICQIYIN